MNDIGKRIAAAREAKGMNQSELARALGVSPQAVQKWESGGGPKGSRLSEIAAALGVAIEYLLVTPPQDDHVDGLRDHLRRQEADYGGGVDEDDIQGVTLHDSRLKPTIEVIDIPIFDAAGSMGLGRPRPEEDTVIDNMRLTRHWVNSRLPSISGPANLAVLSAYGDSMAPTFSDGDLLLIDRGVTDIRLDAVYVLALNNELYIKRVQRRITDGAVIIKSDNPLYDPVVVNNGERQNLEVLGRVVWAWNGKKL